MKEMGYTKDGYLVVSELSRCGLFERDPSARLCNNVDCFFCKFSDFRKQEYIEQVKTDARKGVLYSVCHNEKNKKAT
ncbi:MAG: hypothetical protein E7191_08305 [Erysipelotrichaceae bacterium]|nr:hypothetical protein [Erysipelotrichaceae bacterium]